MKTSLLTIRLEQTLLRQLARAARQSGRNRSDSFVMRCAGNWRWCSSMIYAPA